MKPDEKALWEAVKAGEPGYDAYPRLGIHPNRAQYLFEKWVKKGWWECGVSARTGWVTEKGKGVVAA